MFLSMAGWFVIRDLLGSSVNITFFEKGKNTTRTRYISGEELRRHFATFATDESGSGERAV
jgi:hypothetical protein